jgi:prophage regulatory protein
MSQSIQRLPEVKNRTGLSRSSIYLKMKDGTFPPSIKLSKRAIGWPLASIDSWIEEQIQKSIQGG